MTSIQERATAAALKRSKGQCTTGNVHLDEAIKYYIQVGFEDGAEWQREDLAGGEDKRTEIPGIPAHKKTERGQSL